MKSPRSSVSSESDMHRPVLLKETIELLNPARGAFIIDGTLGGGGHAKAIAGRIGKEGMLLAIDWDREAIERFKDEAAHLLPRVVLMQGNYKDIPKLLHTAHLPKADGVLVDLGFSSFQIDAPERGFSFRGDGPLDMRYAREEGRETAAAIVNGSSEDVLTDIFRTCGEERYARPIAHALVEARRKERIMTTHALAEAVERAIPGGRRGRIHPATKVFQALRIFVNGEFENIAEFLGKAEECVKPGGRIAVISFHSLEDRIVKRAMQAYAKEKKAELITKKPIVPDREEEKENPRSRSAKLRGIQLTI